jgi:hypothetical protein
MMEDDIEHTKLGENSPEQRKKYTTFWRNKWITAKAGNIDDFIKAYEDIAGMMRRWKDKGIILDPDIIGGVSDDYAQFCTYDEGVALQEGFEEEEFEEYDNEERNALKVEAFEEWDDPSDSPILQFEVNEFISLKLIQGETHIYVKGERFNQCHYVLLVNPDRNEQ